MFQQVLKQQVYDQNHILKTLIPTLKWIRNTYFGIDQVYNRVDYTDQEVKLTSKIDYCYDNLKHPLYDKVSNPYPYYQYIEGADLSDPYILHLMYLKILISLIIFRMISLI